MRAGVREAERRRERERGVRLQEVVVGLAESPRPPGERLGADGQDEVRGGREVRREAEPVGHGPRSRDAGAAEAVGAGDAGDGELVAERDAEPVGAVLGAGGEPPGVAAGVGHARAVGGPVEDEEVGLAFEVALGAERPGAAGLNDALGGEVERERGPLVGPDGEPVADAGRAVLGLGVGGVVGPDELAVEAAREPGGPGADGALRRVVAEGRSGFGVNTAGLREPGRPCADGERGSVREVDPVVGDEGDGGADRAHGLGRERRGVPDAGDGDLAGVAGDLQARREPLVARRRGLDADGERARRDGVDVLDVVGDGRSGEVEAAAPGLGVGDGPAAQDALVAGRAGEVVPVVGVLVEVGVGVGAGGLERVVGPVERGREGLEPAEADAARRVEVAEPEVHRRALDRDRAVRAPQAVEQERVGRVPRGQAARERVRAGAAVRLAGRHDPRRLGRTRRP